MPVIQPYGIIKLAVTITLLASLNSEAAKPESKQTQSLHPDVDYARMVVDSPAGSASVHMVLIDLDAVRNGSLVVECAPGGDRAGRTSSPAAIGMREGAIASMNGPYFATAGSRTYPLGFTVMDGRVAQLGNLERPLAGIDPDGEFRIEVAHPRAFVTSEAYFEPIWLWGVNAPAGADAVTMYDPNWGPTVDQSDGIAVSIAPLGDEDPGGIIEIGPGTLTEGTWNGRIVEVSESGPVDIPEDGYALVFRGRHLGSAERYLPGLRTTVYLYDLPPGWESMRWIATLGPWFVHDGHVRDFSDETTYGGNVTGRAMRSVIGTTWNDEIFFAVIRGAGLNVGETAEVLIECNVREAVMCDSGSSSGMWMSGVGTVGNSRAIPLAFIVRESSGEAAPAPELRVWTDRLFRH